ncbi:patatin-like phospholipase RssA [Paraferrimonas sedimenticola]|uniref:PNPLA domain-containing protein n=1 Tax=Paraferrimonas sedimenticola TaxID=375674 RepID=A0AA37RWF5_9GAMM|nr:patatin-like phospholipase RssA [Paraferrimonas sedimenticola]GLP96606.1 hypothetical protein GCM10007895_19120 [Paraferrimonas sedimenticola]
MAKVGVALGSGAAKGWAHIGVLRALKELGVAPDQVAGCSIGALVGAAYANGNLDKLQDWVEGFSSWDVLGLMDFSWAKSGLLGGEKVFDAFQRQIGNVRIETLAVPFTAVAADLYSGREIWFDQGDLRQAVRASCSMPGVLAPVQLNGRWLVDGAVVNPVPVSTCRAMGADVVIAVDLHGDKRTMTSKSPLTLASEPESQTEDSTTFTDLLAKGKDYLASMKELMERDDKSGPNMMAVMSQSMEILELRHKKARLMGDPPEVLVSPRVSDIGTMEFHRADEAIDAGYRAMMAQKENLLAELARFKD